MKTRATFSSGQGTAAPTVLGMVAVFLACALAACQHARRAATEPLDNSGMSYGSVKQLEDLKVTSKEVAEILNMYDAGFPDDDCAEMVRSFHGRGQAFTAGSAVAGLLQAGMDDQTILALGGLNQLGPDWGEFLAMRLAGLSDGIILEVARHRREGKPVLSGAALAGLKNAGVRTSTLLELARRGVPDSEAQSIISYRRRGASDSQLLRRYPGS